VLGTAVFGFIVVKNSAECMISRQYLCQTSSFIIAATLLAFTALTDYSGYVLFVWIYGFFYGGYLYSLKMCLYEKARARNFNRAWGFLQAAQSLPILVGIPVSGMISYTYVCDEYVYNLSSSLSIKRKNKFRNCALTAIVFLVYTCFQTCDTNRKFVSLFIRSLTQQTRFHISITFRKYWPRVI